MQEKTLENPSERALKQPENSRFNHKNRLFTSFLGNSKMRLFPSADVLSTSLTDNRGDPSKIL